MQNNRRFSVWHDRLFQVLTVSGTILLLAAFVILRYEGFLSAMHCVFCAVRPLLLGGLIALILNRPYCRFLHDFTLLSARMRHPLRTKTLRMLAIAASVALALLILTGIVCILLPQLVDSVVLLTDNLQFYGKNLGGVLGRFAGGKRPAWCSQEQLDALFAGIQGMLPKIMQAAYDCTANLFSCLLDFGIGAVFSVYLLADQERLRMQAKEICTRFLHPQRTSRLITNVRFIFDTFARFFSSQLLEALILGVLCFLGMLLFDFPFPVLISVIIGLTNIVPYVGPILGTIPCAMIVLLVKPSQVLWFVLFVIVLQQAESNLIFPRIVGRSVGLPPTWVLASIILGGGLFGAAGMLLGVPLTAVVYAVLFPPQRDPNK